MSRLRGGGRGQALTEVALLTPLLLLVLAATAEIGRSFFVANQMTNSAREGALWAGHHFGDGVQACAGTPNDTYADFKANVICVVQGEESTPLIGCPSGSEVITLSPDPGTQAPFTGTYPPAAGTVKNNLTVTTDCTLQPLMALAPLQSAYHVRAIVTNYVFR